MISCENPVSIYPPLPKGGVRQVCLHVFYFLSGGVERGCQNQWGVFKIVVFLSGGAEEGCEILGGVQTVRLIHPGGAEKGCQPSWVGAWKKGSSVRGAGKHGGWFLRRSSVGTSNRLPGYIGRVGLDKGVAT